MTKKRGIYITLLLSLAINFILLGGVIGMRLANHSNLEPRLNGHPSPSRPAMATFSGPQFFRALPVEQRRAARKLLRKHANEHRELKHTSREIRQEVFALLRADTLDQPALDTGFARLRDVEGQQIKLGQTIVLELLMELDANTRREIVGTMIQHKRRGPMRRFAPPPD